MQVIYFGDFFFFLVKLSIRDRKALDEKRDLEVKEMVLDLLPSASCLCTVVIGVTDLFIGNGGGFLMYILVEGSEC